MKKIYEFVSIILEAFSPKQEDIELYRKELVLNVILGLCILFSFGLLILLIASKTLNQSGISVFDFVLFTSPFLVAYICSRKGWINISSIICISTFSLGTWYAIHTWGFTLPAALLSLVLTTTITGVLISSRAGFIYALVAVIFLASDLHIMNSHGLSPDLSWQQTSIDWNDILELSVFLLFVSGLTWLSNRQTELSLHRARNSEALLMIERDQLEVRVEERTKELEQARVEQISEVHNFIEFGKLSAGLIHDLMSPLNALCLEIEQSAQLSSQHHTLKETLSNMTRASHKIQDIISASKQQIKINLDKENVLLHSLVQDIYLLHKHRLISHNILFKNTINPTLSIDTFPTLLSHVITNLVSNAIDACISKKQLSETVHQAQFVQIAAILSDSKLIIMITDNGCGIDIASIKHIFRPFFSTKKKTGCGYGLSISKHIIEKYFNGSLTLNSQNIKSETTFEICIPVT